MEVSGGQDGIQKLLAAETEAQAIVTRARKGEHLAKQHVWCWWSDG